ncbi:MAG: glycoside hydrolase family 92 protein [Bacteroidales bacterium]|nr:glycoside hydrolase family 92 protein [Bacteroidales bacterium]
MPTNRIYSTSVDSFSSEFDRDFEVISPYYFSENLDKYNIRVEATVSGQSYMYRINYPENKENYIVLDFPGNSALQQINDHTIFGWNEEEGLKKYVYLSFSNPFKLIQESHNDGTSWVLQFDESVQLEIQVGESLISEEQASKNLKREIEGKSFEDIKTAAKEIWNNELNKIEIETDDEDQRITFYTALYRALYSPYSITEDDLYYSAFDDSVHSADGRPFYTADGTWDSYRAKHPLQLILDPQRQTDMMNSYAQMFVQYRIMPVFPFPQGELNYMIGNHVAPIVLDTWNKGYQNFNLPLIYEGLKKNALQMTMLPDQNGPLTELDEFYHNKGYFPALDPGKDEWVEQVNPFYRRQSVSVTLESAYDNYCMKELAKILHHTNDIDLFFWKSIQLPKCFQ